MNNTNDLISRSDALCALDKDIMGGLNYKNIIQNLPSHSAKMICVMQKELAEINTFSAVIEKLLNELILSQKYDQTTITWYEFLTKKLDDLYIKKLNIENQMKEMGDNKE